MTNKFYTFKKLLAYIFISMIFFSFARASEISVSLDKNDSVYKYSAVENRGAFPDLANNINGAENQISLNVVTVQEKSISEKIQDITDNQSFSEMQVNDAMTKLNNRSQVATFLIGNNLGVLKFQIVQINNQIYRLSAIRTAAIQSGDITYLNQIDEQLLVLNRERSRVEKYIPLMESKFSVFGWLVTML